MSDQHEIDRSWLAKATFMSLVSQCSRAKVGAIILDKDGELASVGTNSVRANVPGVTGSQCEEWCARANKPVSSSDGYGLECPSVHAEATALLNGVPANMSGGTLYVTHAPCADCAKLINAVGIARVVSLRGVEQHRPDTITFLRSCGIEVKILGRTERQSEDSSD